MTKKQLLKTQLNLFLKTPIFYITAIIFSVFVMANYFIKQQFFTGLGSSDLLLYFSSIPYISIIIIPALCYKSNFTIYNNFLPFSKTQILITNFLYCFISFCLMLVLLIPGIIIVNCCGSVDFGQIITSFLCLILYGASLISFTLLIQTFCNTQIISFIISAIVLALFNSAHLFSVYFNFGNLISRIFKTISFAWHFDAASKGIIDTRDIIFFAGATFLFIFVNALIQEIKAGKKFLKTQKITNFLMLILTVLIMLNGNRWFTRIDISKNKTFALSAYTKQLCQKANENVKITYYRSNSLNKLYPQIRDVSDFLMTYSSLNKNFTYQIVDPDKENLTELLDSYGIYSQQLRSVSNNSTEFTNVYSAIVLEYNGNVEIIPFTMTAQTLEYDLDGRLLHLLTENTRFVNIIMGNGATLSNDYSYVVPYLTSQGFVCNQLFINTPEFQQQIENASGPLLIIGDEAICIEDAISIENYILQNKGNAFITVSPYNSKIEDDWSLHQAKKCNIVDMLENWDIQFAQSICSDISCARITMYSQDDASQSTKVMNYPLWVSILPQSNCQNGITLFWPVVLNITGDIAKPFLYSSAYAHAVQIERNNKESLIETNPFVLNQATEIAEQKQTIILGAYVNSKLQGLYNDYASKEPVQLTVIPDQYFLNSLMNEYIGGEYGDYRNFEFLASNLLELNGEKELARLLNRQNVDKSLYKLQDFSQIKKLQLSTYVIYFAIIPLVLLIAFILNVKKGSRYGKK